MASHGDIEAHHKILGDVLQGVMNTEELAIVEVGDYQDWKRASWPSVVFFELRKGHFHAKQELLEDQDPLEIIEFIPDYQQRKALREKGGQATVFEICRLNGDISIWANWSEEWHSYAFGEYGLVGGGWCFFFRVADGPFTQLFRAEWDQLLLPNGTPGRGGKAGQPHWHVDLRAEVIHESRSALLDQIHLSNSALVEIGSTEPLQSLDPLKSTTSHSLYRSGVHFAMAASRNIQQGDSWEWQEQVNHDFSKLRSWSIAVFHYVKDEANHLKLD